jgi:hypothetical protein
LGLRQKLAFGLGKSWNLGHLDLDSKFLQAADLRIPKSYVNEVHDFYLCFVVPKKRIESKLCIYCWKISRCFGVAYRETA